MFRPLQKSHKGWTFVPGPVSTQNRQFLAMAIFGKDYHVIANLFSCIYEGQFLVHVASCSDGVLRYLCYTNPLEEGKGPSLILENGRYWESRKGDKMNYVFRDRKKKMKYTLEMIESPEDPKTLFVYLEIRDSNSQVTTWKMERTPGWPPNPWGLPWEDWDHAE